MAEIFFPCVGGGRKGRGPGTLVAEVKQFQLYIMLLPHQRYVQLLSSEKLFGKKNLIHRWQRTGHGTFIPSKKEISSAILSFYISIILCYRIRMPTVAPPACGRLGEADPQLSAGRPDHLGEVSCTHTDSSEYGCQEFLTAYSFAAAQKLHVIKNQTVCNFCAAIKIILLKILNFS